MKRTRESSVYSKWMKNLRDERARYRINARIERLKQGNPGDVEPAGEGISEMKIDYGPGTIGSITRIRGGKSLSSCSAAGIKEHSRRILPTPKNSTAL
jgi:putative addiction module killer protein